MFKVTFKNPVFMLFMLLVIVAAACQGPSTSTPAPSGDDVPDSLTSSPAGQTPVDPELPVTGNDSQSPAGSPTLSPNAPASLPLDRTSHAGDYDSSETAAQKSATGGDRFTFGRYERPFNANTMDQYFSYLDIIDTTAYADAQWVYGVLVLKATDDTGSLPGSYAFEIDLNLDGRGDWLILVKAPASKEWTTQGVQVWNDADGDVGGLITINADKGLASGNGYERLVADGGEGETPEAGFVHIDANSPNTILFALSFSLLDSDDSYMAGMWAGTSALDPAKFDFNDYMTHEQAGAADRGLENFYPIKGLAELDNSCRMAIGFEPTGDEPGLCPELSPKIPEEPSGCQATPIKIRTCNADASYQWNAAKCYCEYIGPR